MADSRVLETSEPARSIPGRTGNFSSWRKAQGTRQQSSASGLFASARAMAYTCNTTRRLLILYPTTATFTYFTPRQIDSRARNTNQILRVLMDGSYYVPQLPPPRRPTRSSNPESSNRTDNILSQRNTDDGTVGWFLATHHSLQPIQRDLAPEWMMLPFLCVPRSITSHDY